MKAIEAELKSSKAGSAKHAPDVINTKRSPTFDFTDMKDKTPPREGSRRAAVC